MVEEAFSKVSVPSKSVLSFAKALFGASTKVSTSTLSLLKIDQLTTKVKAL
jgi:hypothetical protein